MYLDFFGLTEKPFTITPNPRFLFLSKNHKEVFAHLLYGIRNRCGFIEVTGEVGTGKTTVLRTLLNQLGKEERDYRLALIFNPKLSSVELLRLINREFGIATDGATTEELLCALNEFLLQENREGRIVVLVIDEAQNLEPSVLEQIRLLSNLETETDKLIQIVLVGQPELGDLLDRTELRQLSQRITVRYHLRAMDADDTRAYLSHRISVAGGDPNLFTPAAIRRIYNFSGGLPRLINILGDRALLVAFAEGDRRVNSGMVKIAIAELKSGRSRSASRRLWPVLIGLALLCGFLGFHLGAADSPFGKLAALVPDRTAMASLASQQKQTLSDPLPPTDKAASPISAAPAVTAVADEPTLEELRSWLGRFDEGRNLADSASALQRVWGMKGGKGESVEGLREFSRRLSAEGMHLALFRGDLDDLLKLDSPALLEILLPGIADKRFLALTASSEGKMIVNPLPEGRTELSRDLLGRLWSGRAFIPWKNYREVPSLAVPGSKKEGVARLQQLLGAAGVYEGPANGIYDRETIGAVTRFQALRGLVQDGRVGPRTLLALYQSTGSFGVPTIQIRAEGDGK